MLDRHRWGALWLLLASLSLTLMINLYSGHDAPQVFIEDCLANFEAPVANFIQAVNALNGGKGLGLNAGSASPKCAPVSRRPCTQNPTGGKSTLIAPGTSTSFAGWPRRTNGGSSDRPGWTRRKRSSRR